MPRHLEGKFAVVTGASSGVGEAICEALAAEGCGVALVGRRLERLNAVADRLRKLTPNIRVCQTDLTVPAQISALTASIGNDPGTLDILIHSAGTISWGAVADGELEAFDAQFECNARSPYLLTKALLPLLKSSGGQVVFINSTAGLNGKANAVAYSASKHALKGLADGLREEVNADGVRVLSVFLGKTDTPMQEELHRVQGAEYNSDKLLRPQDVATVLIPLLRLPTAAEVTDIVLRPLVKCMIGAATASVMRSADFAASAMAIIG